MTEQPAYKLTPGLLVRNTKMDPWGPGKVLLLSGNTATVHFRDLPTGAQQRKVAVSFLAPTEAQSDEALDLVPVPSADGAGSKSRASGKRAKPRPRKAVGTLQQAVDAFLAQYPKGFEDPAYFEAERARKSEGHERWEKEFGAGEGARLLAAGAVADLCERALAVEGQADFLHPVERSALRAALSDPAVAPAYFEALFALADEAAPSEAAFAAYASALAALPTKGKTSINRWTAASVLPSMARPDTHVLVKPDSTRLGAARLGLDLDYKPIPNWSTYRGILDYSTRLLEALQPHGARDLIDVQAFVWATRTTP